MARTNLRTRTKKIATELSGEHWILGELLNEIDEKGSWKKWEFSTFEDYVEQDLGISRSRASRLIRVDRVFGDLRESEGLDEVPWSCLAEALPIATKETVDEAIKLAKLGLADIRHWKEARKKRQMELNIPIEEQKDWHTLNLFNKLRLPPDVYREVTEVVNLARRVCAQLNITVTDDNPFQLLQAIALEAKEGLLAQAPPDEEDPIGQVDETAEQAEAGASA